MLFSLDAWVAFSCWCLMLIFSVKNRLRDQTWCLVFVNFDHVTCFDARIKRQHENTALGWVSTWRYNAHFQWQNKSRINNQNWRLIFVNFDVTYLTLKMSINMKRHLYVTLMSTFHLITQIGTSIILSLSLSECQEG